MRWRLAPLALSLAASPLAAQVPMGPEFVVSTGTTIPGASVRAASAPDGRFVIVWNDQSRDGSGFGVFGRVFAADGQPVGEDFQVNTYTAGDQSLWFEPPSVSFGGDGFVVAWASDEQDGEWWGVFAQRFGPDGMRLGAEVQVSSGTSGCPNGAEVAMSPNGRFVVSWGAWTQGTELDLRAQLFDASGNRVGGEFLVNTYTTWSQDRHAIAMDGNERFVLAWDPDTRGCAHARRYDAEGQPATPEFAVNLLFTGSDHWPGTAVEPFGNFVVAWPYVVTTGDTSIRARRYYGGVVPVQLTVDAAAGPASDGNGVLEACETVAMEPAWQNETAGRSPWMERCPTSPGLPAPRIRSPTAAGGTRWAAVGSRRARTVTASACHVHRQDRRCTGTPRSQKRSRPRQATAYCPSASVTREQMPALPERSVRADAVRPRAVTRERAAQIDRDLHPAHGRRPVVDAV